jgi:hypothetical protein
MKVLFLTAESVLAAEDVFMPAATDSEGKEIEVADIGDWTERILQRRLAIVTDHYIVLADYLEGKEEHTFDNLLQIRGFQNIEVMESKKRVIRSRWARILA